MLIFLKKIIKKFFKFFGYKLVIFKKKKLPAVFGHELQVIAANHHGALHFV